MSKIHDLDTPPAGFSVGKSHLARRRTVHLNWRTALNNAQPGIFAMTGDCVLDLLSRSANS